MLMINLLCLWNKVTNSENVPDRDELRDEFPEPGFIFSSFLI